MNSAAYVPKCMGIIAYGTKELEYRKSGLLSVYFLPAGVAALSSLVSPLSRDTKRLTKQKDVLIEGSDPQWPGSKHLSVRSSVSSALMAVRIHTL